MLSKNSFVVWIKKVLGIYLLSNKNWFHLSRHHSLNSGVSRIGTAESKSSVVSISRWYTTSALNLSSALTIFQFSYLLTFLKTPSPTYASELFAMRKSKTKLHFAKNA